MGHIFISYSRSSFKNNWIPARLLLWLWHRVPSYLSGCKVNYWH